MASTNMMSPPGSSTYFSDTLYVGDGTWDASRNTFLLPNLVGLNFETMRYNGMGNRFAALPQYHRIVVGHGVLAVLTFLFIVPVAIMTAQFYSRSPSWALRIHIYLQVITCLLSTVVFTLGWFAVGPSRSLTNPHHGIGTAIYVLVLIQTIGGWLIHKQEKKMVRTKLPIKLVLHQWLGRVTAMLGFAQIPLGLTLYGSPKFTFILYSLWMAFLLVLFFILSYRALPPLYGGITESSVHRRTVTDDLKPHGLGGLLGPLAAGGAAAFLQGRNRSRGRSRSRSYSGNLSRVRRQEVLSSGQRSRSRKENESFVEDEKHETRREGGGMMDKIIKGAVVLGAAGLAKSWYGKKQEQNADEYSPVAPDTPSRPHKSRKFESEIDEDSVSVSRMEEGFSRRSNKLPEAGGPVRMAAPNSTTESRPVTPRPIRRTDSYTSIGYSDSTILFSGRHKESHKSGNVLFRGLGLRWFANKIKDKRDQKEIDRPERIEVERAEERRKNRRGKTPRLTGDGFKGGRRHSRLASFTHSTNLSTIDDPHAARPGAISPIPAGKKPGTKVNTQSGLQPDAMEPVIMPPMPHDPQGILHHSSSESWTSTGGHPHTRHSSRRRREGEAAAAAAVAGAASLAAEEEARRMRSKSRGTELQGNIGTASPVSIKMKLYDDKDRHVTLRRLTEQEAAAEREARKSNRRRRRTESLSSLSGTDTGASNRRYRRSERSEVDASNLISSAQPPPPPPPQQIPLSPPNPAFAEGRKLKDSAYYSGRSGQPRGSGLVQAVGGGSPESYATWSAMSPDSRDGAEVAAERRRRRRLERNQKSGNAGGTIDFS